MIKQNHARWFFESKAPTVISNIEIVTENVLVPRRKTTVMECYRQAVRSRRNNKSVQLCRSYNSISKPLLKRPSKVSVKTYATRLLRVKQMGEEDQREKAKPKASLCSKDEQWNDWKKSKTSRNATGTIEECSTNPGFYANVNSYFEQLARQSREKRKKERRRKLPFPCTIASVPVTATNLCTKNTAFSRDENTMVSSNLIESDLKYEKISKKEKSLGDTLDSPVLSRNTTDSTRKEENEEKDGFEQLEFTAFSVSRSSCFLEETTLKTGLLTSNRNDEIPSLYSLRESYRDSLHTAKPTELTLLRGKRSRYENETCFSKIEYPCKRNYSWQVVGRGCQTSRTLLDSLIEENTLEDESTHGCSIKYSWQIIGTATQTSVNDFLVSRRRSNPSPLSAKANGTRRDVLDTSNYAETGKIWRNGKRFIILSNQCSQTIAHQANQTNYVEIYTKYQE